MPKVTTPTKCAKCGSDKLRHEELTMRGKYGMMQFSGVYTFNVYICKECAYSELYFSENGKSTTPNNE